jgi:hypothetical protein
MLQLPRLTLLIQLFPQLSRQVHVTLWRLAEAARATFFPYAT